MPGGSSGDQALSPSEYIAAKRCKTAAGPPGGRLEPAAHLEQSGHPEDWLRGLWCALINDV